ncbi:hypothetical protein sos41_11880 [Alphaproteobacteria bacterium SO-S41]|nr:hypothetical protein sos41_11880 [Alphaproteobacteria bacterium SO-S41]
MRNLGRAVIVRFGYQADAVTPATADFVRPPFYGFTPPADPGLQQDPVLGGVLHNSRDATEGTRELQGGQLRMSVPLDLIMLPHWLRMALGAGVSSGAGPNYVHTFTSGKATLPSVTIEAKFASGDFGRYEGCVLNSISLPMRKEAAVSRLDLTFLIRKHDYYGAFLAGAEAATLTRQKIVQSRGIAKWGGVTISNLLDTTFGISNNCEPYNTMSGDDFPLEIDPGFTTINGTARLRLQDSTFRTISKGNTPGAFNPILTHASDPTNRLFSLNMPVTRLTAQGPGVDGPGGIDETFNWESEQTDVAPTLTAVVKNGTAAAVYGY